MIYVDCSPEILYLNENRLEGTLPDELYDLESLQWLYLQSNKFSGSISARIGKMKNLNQLIFRLNAFTGTIPMEIGNLTKLGRLFELKSIFYTSCIYWFSHIIALNDF